MKAIDIGACRRSEAPRVVFHRDAADLAELEPAWSRLAESTDGPVFFQSFAWICHIAKVRLEKTPKSWRLCLATLWRADDLVGVWPLSLQKAGFCWIVKCLDDPFGQFAGLLLDPDENPMTGIDAVIRELKAEGVAAGLQIERVIEGSALHHQLAAAGASVAFSDQSVYLDFHPFERFEDYQKSVNAKTRKNLRNAANRLTRDHQFFHEVTSEQTDIAAIIREAFEGRLVWMQDNAKTAPAFRDPAFRPVLDLLMDSPVKTQLLAFRLKTAKETISVQWGFLHQNRYYAFISARNPAFDSYSPGRIHLGKVLESCFRRRIEVVELMAPASDYKLNWTKSCRRIDDFGLPFTPGGYLYLEVWRRHGRAMAKRLYNSLPDSLRRHVSQATNKNNAP